MSTISHRRVLGTTGATLLVPAVPLYAATKTVSANTDGAAIDGYDTTAYWQIAAPRIGNSAYAITWQGAQWLFADAGAAATFTAEPDRYAPQFGGHCTRAMSFGKVVNGDPHVWRIYRDKLYLFAQAIGGEKFDGGQDAMIALAQTQWDKLG